MLQILWSFSCQQLPGCSAECRAQGGKRAGRKKKRGRLELCGCQNNGDNSDMSRKSAGASDALCVVPEADPGHLQSSVMWLQSGLF